MNNLKQHIDQQINHNKNKNLFYPDLSNMVGFTDTTIKKIEKLSNLTPEDLEILANYTTEKAIQEFCMVNQYYAFTSKDKKELQLIYKKLFESILGKNTNITEISSIHYQNLKEWLQKTNAFAQRMYSQQGSELKPVACSEYNAELQLKVLDIELTSIVEPILDIGCGTQGNLVKYLSERGFEAFGVDRFAEDLPNIEKVDWLEYDYGIKRWGTIISNLGFSNHFRYHHFRKDGNFVGYANKYMEILKSLKAGGSFYYAPDLSFIETYLGDDYEVRTTNIYDSVNRVILFKLPKYE